MFIISLTKLTTENQFTINCYYIIQGLRFQHSYGRDEQFDKTSHNSNGRNNCINLEIMYIFTNNRNQTKDVITLNSLMFKPYLLFSFLNSKY